MVQDGGGGVSRVMGPHMLRLQQYLLAADANDIDTHVTNWRASVDQFRAAATQFDALAKACGDAFAESSSTAGAAAASYGKASAQMLDKAATIEAACRSMSVVAQRYDEAKQTYDYHEGRLPSSHGPAPSASDAEFSTEGLKGSEKKARETALGDAKEQHAKEAKAIADAERDAAFQCQQVDDGNQQAEPKVRAITEEASTSGGTNGGSAGGSSGGYSSPGSRSVVQAAQAKHDSVNPGTLYADGDGYQIRAAQSDIIAQAHADNIPEWDNDAGMWVSSDGSPAPATNYASVETAEGLAPLGGGIGGAGALGVGLGGAGLAAGAVAALKAKFGAGAAAAASRAGVAGKAGGVSKASAAASSSRAAAGRTAGAGSRAGAPGQGSRSAGKGMRGAGGRGGTGAGSRSQMRGGAGGRGGKGKDRRDGDPDIDLMADYSADYSDEEYERLLAQKRFDDEQKRQFGDRSGA